MTPAQTEALDKAYDLLSEHFDCSVIVTNSATEEDSTDEIRMTINGGFTNGLGLVTYAQHRMLTGDMTGPLSDIATPEEDNGEEEDDKS